MVRRDAFVSETNEITKGGPATPKHRVTVSACPGKETIWRCSWFPFVYMCFLASYSRQRHLLGELGNVPGNTNANAPAFLVLFIWSAGEKSSKETQKNEKSGGTNLRPYNIVSE